MNILRKCSLWIFVKHENLKILWVINISYYTFNLYFSEFDRVEPFYIPKGPLHFTFRILIRILIYFNCKVYHFRKGISNINYSQYKCTVPWIITERRTHRNTIQVINNINTTILKESLAFLLSSYNH